MIDSATGNDPKETLTLSDKTEGISPVDGLDKSLNVSFSDLKYSDSGTNAGCLTIFGKVVSADSDDDSMVVVRFDEVCGFRVLSESDLIDFHKDFDFACGWLFEIRSGGWFDQESQRPGFLRQHVPFYREYLFEDADIFVSVLCKVQPSVEII